MPSELLSLGVFSYCLDLLEFDHPSRSLQTFLKRSPCFFQSEAADITRRRIRICMSQDRLNDRQRVSFLIQDRRRQMPDAVEPEGFDFGPATEILHQMLPMEEGLPVILPAKVGFLQADKHVLFVIRRLLQPCLAPLQQRLPQIGCHSEDIMIPQRNHYAINRVNFFVKRALRWPYLQKLFIEK